MSTDRPTFIDQPKRYQTDSVYRDLVDMMHSALARGRLTVIDVLDAALYANRLTVADPDEANTRLGTVGGEPAFDSDFSPEHPDNVAAARARGLTYDRKERVYRDNEGCPILDTFGQPIG